MVHVNYMAVLVAAITVFVLGWLWYSPLLFLKPMMRARGQDPAAAMAGAKMPTGKLVTEFLRCIVIAFVVAHFVAQLGITSWMGAVHFGILTWVGFPVVILIGAVLWENMPQKVALIHAGDWLVKMLVLSIMLTLWR